MNTNISYAKTIDYNVYNKNTFKSFEDADCITDRTSPAYKFKKYYKISKYGIWKAKGRYCIAIGTGYTQKIGTKVDVYLSYKGKVHILKCILADQKAISDTHSNYTLDNNNRTIEFVVNTSSLPYKVSHVYGDISYCSKGSKFKGKIIKLRIDK